jgi:hypothetical protein
VGPTISVRLQGSRAADAPGARRAELSGARRAHAERVVRVRAARADAPARADARRARHLFVS